MPKFAYNEVVRVKAGATPGSRHDRAWVVGIFEERPGPYFDKFPEGVVYTIEFEDGTSGEVHESSLEADPLATGTPQEDASRYA